MDVKIKELNDDTKSLLKQYKSWEQMPYTDYDFDCNFIDPYGDYIENIQCEISVGHSEKAYQMILNAFRHTRISARSCGRLIYNLLLPWIKRLNKQECIYDHQKYVIRSQDFSLFIQVGQKPKLKISAKQIRDLIKEVWIYQKKCDNKQIDRFKTIIKNYGQVLDISQEDHAEWILYFYSQDIKFELDYNLLKSRILQRIQQNKYGGHYQDWSILYNCTLTSDDRSVVLEIIIKSIENPYNNIIDSYLILKSLKMWSEVVMKDVNLGLRIWKAIVKQDDWSCSILTSRIIPELYLFLDDTVDFSKDTNVLKMIFTIIDYNWAHDQYEFKHRIGNLIPVIVQNNPETAQS